MFVSKKKVSTVMLCLFFKLRHFDKYIQKAMLSWLSKQPWYLPRAMSANAAKEGTGFKFSGSDSPRVGRDRGYARVDHELVLCLHEAR